MKIGLSEEFDQLSWFSGIIIISFIQIVSSVTTKAHLSYGIIPVNLTFYQLIKISGNRYSPIHFGLQNLNF